MPRWITRHFTRSRQREISIRRKNPLFITQQSRHHLAARIDNGCAAIMIELIKRLKPLRHMLRHAQPRRTHDPRAYLARKRTAQQQLPRLNRLARPERR